MRKDRVLSVEVASQFEWILESSAEAVARKANRIQDLSKYGGGISPSWTISGWGYDVDGDVLHFYEPLNSVSICGHTGRPTELFTGGLDEFYHDLTTTWYFAVYCTTCTALFAETKADAKEK